MKRNLLCGLLALAMVLALSACGGKEPSKSSGGGQTDRTSQPAQPDQSAQPGGADVAEYVFRAGDTTVSIDQDMAEVLSALGEPKEYFEAESCAFEGMDKTYTYSGFVITTRPDPLWGSSSRARSLRYTFSMLGITWVSMKRLMKVDLPVRTGPTTPM